MSEIEHLADRQAVWSTTANACKAQLDRARWGVFGLSFAGAGLAALSSQIEPGKVVVSGLSAILLALAAFLTARVVNRDRITRHVRARSASEALKHQAFLFVTGVAPYADPATRGAKLAEAQEEIEKGVENLAGFEVQAPGKGNVPRKALNLNEYIELRLIKQIKYYRTNADKYIKLANVLRTMEVVCALVAALLAAVSTPLTAYIQNFDVAALAAVLTTLGGIVLAHLQASRYDDMVGSYRATARRLERIKADKDRLAPTDLILATEAAIQAETQSWSAFWSEEP